MIASGILKGYEDSAPFRIDSVELLQELTQQEQEQEQELNVPLQCSVPVGRRYIKGMCGSDKLEKMVKEAKLLDKKTKLKKMKKIRERRRNNLNV